MHPLRDLPLGDRTAPPLKTRRLGFRAYADACAVQEQAARLVASGGADQLLLVEHPAVITLGRGFRADQLLASRAALRAAGIAVASTDRGGGATYHGPGQLVGYPIVDLRRRRLGVRSFLRAVEAALLDALHGQQIEAWTRPGLTGVWTEAGKVAAIGISVRHGVTHHGFALNVDPELSAFSRIVPCGLTEPVTSMRALGWRGRAGLLGSSVARRLGARLAAATERRESNAIRCAPAPGLDPIGATGARA
jgi:lipoate-protein ligase B